MNSKGIIAINDQSVCMKCLQKKATHEYAIYGRGYGSDFDEASTHLQLCDNCHHEEYHEWFNESPCSIEDGYCETYQHEEKIHKLIESLPLEAQELFHNTFASGWTSYNMDAQDWIDYKLEELPHEKCKENNLYSPQEIKAYEDRFPTCNNVFLKIWSDGSSCCRCSLGAIGDKDGSCGLNISTECYQCARYAPKSDKMKVISEIDEFIKNEKQRLLDMLEYSYTRLAALDNGYEAYIEEYGN